MGLRRRKTVISILVVGTDAGCFLVVEHYRSDLMRVTRIAELPPKVLVSGRYSDRR